MMGNKLLFFVLVLGLLGCSTKVPINEFIDKRHFDSAFAVLIKHGEKSTLSNDQGEIAELLKAAKEIESGVCEIPDYEVIFILGSSFESQILDLWLCRRNNEVLGVVKHLSKDIYFIDGKEIYVLIDENIESYEKIKYDAIYKPQHN